MPPKGSGSSHFSDGQDGGGHGKPYYSDEDIAILHDIVVLASELLPTLRERERLPTNALFTAYYDILPRVGVDTDHDSRYARILFKIGGMRGPGNIYDKFEDVLERMGIQVQFDNRSRYEDGDTSRFEEVEEEAPERFVENAATSATASNTGIDSPRGRPRARSQDSNWATGAEQPLPSTVGYDWAQSTATEPTPSTLRRDATREPRIAQSTQSTLRGDSTWGTRSEQTQSSTHQKSRQRSGTGPQPLSTRRHTSLSLTDGKHQLPTGDTLQEAQSVPGRPQRTGSGPPEGNSLSQKVGTWLSLTSNTTPKASYGKRDRSVSTLASLHITRAPEKRSTTPSYSASDDWQVTSELTGVTSGFEDETTATSSRPAAGYQPTSQALLDIKVNLFLRHSQVVAATRFVRQWRDRAICHREIYKSNDGKADRIDRLALLRSAMVVWKAKHKRNQVALETEMFYENLEEKAHRARDLYLKQQGFSHWQTWANEQVWRTQQARDHVVKFRLFSAWKEITAINELKVRKNVTKKFFGVWKKSYALVINNNDTAIQKYESNLVEKSFKKWSRQFWGAAANSWYEDSTKKKSLHQWIARSYEVWDAQREAEERRARKLALKSLEDWQRKFERYTQREQEANLLAEKVLCYNSLKRWGSESRYQPAKLLALTIGTENLVRQTFETWALRTRQERQAAALYRSKLVREAIMVWRLQARARLVSARVDRRVVIQAMFKWMLKERAVYSERALKLSQAACALQAWREQARMKTQKNTDMEKLAATFATNKAKNAVMRQWYSRMETLQRNEIIASQLYKRPLQREAVACMIQKSEHLARIGRWAVKADWYFTVKRTLLIWRESAFQAQRKQRKQAYMLVRQIVKTNLARRAIQGWRATTHHVMDLNGQAQELRQNKDIIKGMEIFDQWRGRAEDIIEMNYLAEETAARKHFGKWRNRSNAVRELETEAIITYQERREGRALRKWSLAALKIRAQEKAAAELQEKNSKKNFRKIFEYWHLKELQARPRSGYEDYVNIDALTKELSSTPIPGYLATPSKRSTRRVAGTGPRMSTTPQVPLSTPFERRLRAQYSGTGRSRFGRSSGFSDIPEGSGRSISSRR